MQWGLNDVLPNPPSACEESVGNILVCKVDGTPVYQHPSYRTLEEMTNLGFLVLLPAPCVTLVNHSILCGN